MSITAAINGMGRIGRSLARLISSSGDLRLIAANDIADMEMIKYLLSRDSVHRPANLDLGWIGGVKFSRAGDPDECDFDGADVVFDCTGKHLRARELNGYLEKGARRVVISAPPADSSVKIAPPLTRTNAPIVSAGSCTSNALYLLCEVMRENFGLEAVLATSIHSYTSDQRLLDGNHGEPRRGRSAALNIIPVATAAAKNLARYSREYEKNSAAIGIRIPTPDVSIMHAVFLLENQAGKDEINAAFARSSEKIGSDVLGFGAAHNVLADIIGSRASAIIDGALTMSAGKMAGVAAWHDNEIGFAARMLDLARI